MPCDALSSFRFWMLVEECKAMVRNSGGHTAMELLVADKHEIYNQRRSWVHLAPNIFSPGRTWQTVKLRRLVVLLRLHRTAYNLWWWKAQMFLGVNYALFLKQQRVERTAGKVASLRSTVENFRSVWRLRSLSLIKSSSVAGTASEAPSATCLRRRARFPFGLLCLVALPPSSSSLSSLFISSRFSFGSERSSCKTTN